MTKSSLVDAYILHRRPYRETSYLVDLWTAGDGVVAVVAKGAARPKSRWRGLIEPFLPLQVVFTGKGDLKTLQVLEQTTVMPPLLRKNLLGGIYLNELLLRLLPKELALPNLFQVYAATVDKLRVSSDLEQCLRYFELDLLTELGFAMPILDEAMSKQPIVAGANYCFVPETGFYLVDQYQAAHPDDGQQSLLSFDGSMLVALASRQLLPEHLLHAKLLLRGVLKYYLGDKPLRVREFAKV